MTKEIRLNAFDMNCVVHQSAGLWTHPRDRAVDYTSLEYWTELAQILERGYFDGLFIADVLGVYDVYGGNVDTALSQGIQVPLNDPVLVIPPMAQVTKHLGFGVTCTLSFEPPYPFARRMSTLDHLTRGRIGWNIVTGYLNSAAKGVGMDSAERARPSLRHRRRIHGGRLQAVGGKLGGRRGSARPRQPHFRAARQGP